MGNSLRSERVLITDSVDQSCLEILRTAGIQVDFKPGTKPDELIKIIPDYSALIVRSATKVTAEVIKASKGLWLIGRAGTGVDNIDLDAATDRGIIVLNTPLANTLSAAEHTCAMICCLPRSIPQACASFKSGKWERKKFMGSELDGKTLGIIGLGKIGKEVATRMQSFGMKTIGYDPIILAEEAATFNVEWMELSEIWPQVDYVTVHTPLIPQTRGLMNDTVFGQCKKGVRVVNVARGGIIDEDALLRALDNGQCGGAALDVFVEEPPTNRALVEHEKVVATPHLGASTVEAQCRVAQDIAHQFVGVLKEDKIGCVVNVPYIMDALQPSAEPWMKLLTTSGALARTLLGENPKMISLSVSGEEIKPFRRFLLPAAIVGVLGDGILGKMGGEGNITIVNAMSKAKQLNLETEYEFDEDGPCIMCVEVFGSEGREKEGASAGGTVKDKEAVLLVAGGRRVAPVELCTGHLMVFVNSTLSEVGQQIPDAKQLCFNDGIVVAFSDTKPPTCKPTAAVYVD